MYDWELPPTEDQSLWESWGSLIHMPTLTAAEEIGLFRALASGGLCLEDLGKVLGLSERVLLGVCGLMAALGFLVKQDGTWSLTRIARTYLLPESPFYWGGFLKLVRDNPVTHQSVLEALKRDKPAWQEGQVYEQNEINEAQAAAFTRGMHAVSLPAALASARSGAFSGVERVLDIGGGSGNLGIALAKNDPELRATILDLASVCRVADEYIRTAGVAGRVNTLAGDFFEDPWPAGYDAVFFGNIFHNWSAALCGRLAEKAFACLPTGGRIFLQEMLLNDTCDGPLAVAASAMAMVWGQHGQQFNASALKELLHGCGFVQLKVVPTFGYYSLISGCKP